MNEVICLFNVYVYASSYLFYGVLSVGGQLSLNAEFYFLFDDDWSDDNDNWNGDDDDNWNGDDVDERCSCRCSVSRLVVAADSIKPTAYTYSSQQR